MQYRRVLLAPLFASTMMLCFNACAGVLEQSKTCNGCSKADVEYVLQNCGAGGYGLVADFKSHVLYKGCFSYETGGPANENPIYKTKLYYWSQPNSEEYQAFENYYDLYQNDGHQLEALAVTSVHVNLQPKVSTGRDDGYLNAYDVVMVPADDGELVNWLNTTNFTTADVSGAYVGEPYSPSLGSALTRVLNSIKTGVVSFNFKVQLTIVFHDGSSVTYKVTDNGNWSRVLGMARDAHGNIVPYSATDIAPNGGSATYAFGGNGPNYDQSNFIHMLSLYGIGVAENGSSSQTITCTWSVNQHILQCYGQ